MKKRTKEKLSNFIYLILHLPEARGVYNNTVVSVLVSLTVGFFAFHLMTRNDFSQLFGNSGSCQNFYDKNATITSIFIACASMLASSVGLLIAAFVFLNDSLKKRADVDPSLNSIVNYVTRIKAIELIFISSLSIISIVGSLYCNTFINNATCFYICISICISLIAYIIIFACGIVNSERIVYVTSRILERRYRKKALKTYKKIKKHSSKNNGSSCFSQRYPASNYCDMLKALVSEVVQNDAFSIASKNIDDKKEKCSDLDQSVIRYIKDTHQIEVELKTLCDSNIEPNISDQIDRMQNGFKWLFGTNATGEPTIQDTVRYLNILKKTFLRHSDLFCPNGKCKEEIWNNIEKTFYEIDKSTIVDYNDWSSYLNQTIESFFTYYKDLVQYKEALMHIDSRYYTYLKNKSKFNSYIKSINDLLQIELRVFLDYFLSFVKIGNMNLGSSVFEGANFNNSDLSNGCYVNSDFRLAYLNNTVMNGCDLSCSSFENASAIKAQITHSNLSYCNLVGVNLHGANLSNCTMEGVIFRDPKIDQNLLKQSFEDAPIHLFIEQLNKIESQYKHDPLDLVKQSRFAEHSLELFTSEVIRCFSNLPSQNIDSINKQLSLLRESRVNTNNINSTACFNHVSKANYNIAVLSNTTLNNVNINAVDLSNVNVDGASFYQSSLTKSLAIHTTGKGTVFTKANIKEAIYGYSNLAEAVFDHANLYSAHFFNVEASKASFSHASMVNVMIINDFSNFVALNHVINKDLETCKKMPAWKDIGMNEAIAIDALIFNAIMDESHFSKSRFKRAIFYNSTMRWSSFINCDFSYALTIGCTFFQSDFTDALFSKSKIMACDFSNANLQNAILINATIIKSIFSNTSFEKSNLSNATFKFCYFEDVTFEDAFLSKTRFINCIFKDMRLPRQFAKVKKYHFSKLLKNMYYDKDGNIYIQTKLK